MSKQVTQHTVESLKARTVEEGECWLWQGYITNKTPQVFTKVDGKKKMASVRRLMSELVAGKPLPPGHFGYGCGNFNCVNPDHAVWKSEATHLRDMAKKRRVSTVTATKLRKYRIETGQAKLSESKAQEIRLSNESGPVLAERYGVSRSWINKIRRGRAWRVLSSPFVGLFK